MTTVVLISMGKVLPFTPKKIKIEMTIEYSIFYIADFEFFLPKNNCSRLIFN